jgi:hypothetical protein
MVDNLLEKKSEGSVREGTELLKARKKCREYVLSKKIKVFMYLVKLFHRAVSEDEAVAQEIATHTENFWRQIITKIDENIVAIESSDRFSSNQANELTRQLT